MVTTQVETVSIFLLANRKAIPKKKFWNQVGKVMQRTQLQQGELDAQSQ